jgi:hypothetical protein
MWIRKRYAVKEDLSRIYPVGSHMSSMRVTRQLTGCFPPVQVCAVLSSGSGWPHSGRAVLRARESFDVRSRDRKLSMRPIVLLKLPRFHVDADAVFKQSQITVARKSPKAFFQGVILLIRVYQFP